MSAATGLGILFLLFAVLTARRWPLDVRWTPRMPAPAGATASNSTRAGEPLAKFAEFLSTADWAQKKGLVLEPERIGPAGAAYYTGREPDEIRASDFQRCELPSLAGRSDIAAFEARRDHRRPVLALFLKVQGEWKLDWESFCQSYDETFPEFIRNPSFEQKVFRLRIQRGFQSAGPVESYRVVLCDEIDPSQQVEIDLTNGSLLRDKVATGLLSRPDRIATVQMSWFRSSDDGTWHPALQNLICWGRQGITEEAALPKIRPSGSPTDVPLAKAGQ
ncbi:MAG: hypothetical protein ACR2OZ_16790 [Verrucomicrobiales bacterium]